MRHCRSLAARCDPRHAVVGVRQGFWCDSPKGLATQVLSAIKYASKIAAFVADARSAHFVHQGLELVDVLKAAVHAGVAHIGYLVELLQFAHDQLANATGQDFALA